MLLGKLQKLKIEPYLDIEEMQSAGPPFEAQFNPSTYTRVYEIEYDTEPGTGSGGAPPRLSNIKAQDYTFELLFDGTGVGQIGLQDVSETIDTFLTTCARINGESHRPNFLKISWGDLILHCVLKSASTAYTLFKPDGKPLRAKVTAVFTEAIPEQLRVAEAGLASPDLTHVRSVKRGETLPNLTNEIYGSPDRYAEVARFNDLDDLRTPAAGLTVRFPPLAELP